MVSLRVKSVQTQGETEHFLHIYALQDLYSSAKARVWFDECFNTNC